MQEPYRHEAMPYSGYGEFLASCRALADEGRSRDEQLTFLMDAGKLADLRDALGAEAEDVAFVSTDEQGRNPARIPTLLESFLAAADGRHCRAVHEPVSGRLSPAALREAQLAESVLNSPRLRSWPLALFCLYDVTVLDADALAQMRCGHPTVRGQRANPAYEPKLADTLFRAPLSELPADAQARDVTGSDLAAMRGFVRAFARAHGLSDVRREDLVLAANEVVTNSIRHGGGSCRIALWDDDGVVCDVRDDGVIDDPLVGRLTPPPTAPAGRGLWLANRLCELVQIRSSQAGTVVRLFVER